MTQDSRQSTAIDHLLDCLESATKIAKESNDAGVLVKCSEVYLDLAKLLGEKQRGAGERPVPPKVAAGLEAEGEN